MFELSAETLCIKDVVLGFQVPVRPSQVNEMRQSLKRPVTVSIRARMAPILRTENAPIRQC